ncbi:MAG: 3-hydroxyacyl-CoA dehydrogenase NAD-binding domain-containing protein, partial [Thermodesulfobacteriota bacterium]
MSKIDSILVLGSGKMAENIGFFFLAKGLSVSWASPSKERLERLAKKAERLRRRFQRVDGTEKPGGADFLQFPFKPQSAYQLCIEASHEDLAHKRKLLGHLDELVGDSTLLVTTSSSILPEKIHPRCLGCHFFYPLELSPAVELISGAGHGREKINNLA